MAFEFDKPPRAGKTFRFLRKERDARRVTVIVDGKEVGVRSEECPDPPCHEYINIPKHAAGRQVVLQEIATNAQIVSELILIVE
jgi:hypothetical protein